MCGDGLPDMWHTVGVGYRRLIGTTGRRILPMIDDVSFFRYHSAGGAAYRTTGESFTGRPGKKRKVGGTRYEARSRGRSSTDTLAF